MYFFVGKMMVLQPDKEHRFIAKDEPYHDMLPATPGLWVLRQPNEAASSPKHSPSLAAMANGELADAGYAAVKSPKSQKGKPKGSSKGMSSNAEGSHTGNGASGAESSSVALATVNNASAELAFAEKQKGKPAASLKEAVMDLMNYPHPLDTLGEPSAYGPDGAISRYHNPDHYCRAIGGVLRTKTKPLRMHHKSSRWYLHLQEKDRAMKRKVRSMRHARHEIEKKQQRHLQKQLSQKKCQPPPCVLHEWKRASQHTG